MAVGATTVDFGAGGSSYASADVTGQSGLSAASHFEAYFMAEASVSNTVDAHVVAPVRLRCEFLSSSSFRIHVVSDWPLRDVFNVRWVTVA